MKKQINYLILINLLLISILLTLSSFLYLENRIYKMNYEELPGDCGQFVIWTTAAFYNKDLALQDLSLNTNPFRLFTGPLAIKEELKKLGIKTTFYNDFSLEEIKRKIDEKKLVIVMVNVNATKGLESGLTHYLLVFDYKQENGILQGFYFFDSYYFVEQYEKNESFDPIYLTTGELEEKRQDVMQPGQFVGEIQDVIGMHKFAIVVGEAEQDRGVNKKMSNIFKLQHYAEKIAAFVGKFVMKISKKV